MVRETDQRPAGTAAAAGVTNMWRRYSLSDVLSLYDGVDLFDERLRSVGLAYCNRLGVYDADEIVGRAFFKLWLDFDRKGIRVKVHGQSSPRLAIEGAFLNKLKTEIENRRKECHRYAELDVATLGSKAANPFPVTAKQEPLEKGRLEAAIQSLPHPHSEIIQRKYFAGWSLRKYSRESGVPLHNLCELHREALEILKEHLEAEPQ